ncbi:MAG: hypothetical protein ISR76_11135 [Planctomycetes bacterium]|nr:hypothetical protein [Planctomycetota bacterium]MBL7009543.1 hypothetical protein [Planctomycetota bacterium]
MDFNRVWLPYLYLYGVGGLFFFGSLALVVRSGACDRTRFADRRWFRVLFTGFLWIAGLHLAGNLLALFL